jgi:hypothetical protein
MILFASIYRYQYFILKAFHFSALFFIVKNR